MTRNFRVFITNLGKYNEGELVGKWLDLPCDDLEEELASIGVAEANDALATYSDLKNSRENFKAWEEY